MTEPSAAGREALGEAARLWWLSVLRGSLALLLGLGALIFGASRAALVNFMAVYWLLGGLLVVRWALKVRWRAGSRIGLGAGLLGVVAGVALLARAALSEVLSEEGLLGLVGLTIVATGCLRLIGAFEVEARTGHRWTLGGIVLGAVEAILGTALIVLRDAQTSTVRSTIGVWGLVAGTLLLVQGAGMYRLHRATAASPDTPE